MRMANAKCQWLRWWNEKGPPCLCVVRKIFNAWSGHKSHYAQYGTRHHRRRKIRIRIRIRIRRLAFNWFMRLSANCSCTYDFTPRKVPPIRICGSSAEPQLTGLIDKPHSLPKWTIDRRPTECGNSKNRIRLGSVNHIKLAYVLIQDEFKYYLHVC